MKKLSNLLRMILFYDCNASTFQTLLAAQHRFIELSFSWLVLVGTWIRFLVQCLPFKRDADWERLFCVLYTKCVFCYARSPIHMPKERLRLRFLLLIVSLRCILYTDIRIEWEWSARERERVSMPICRYRTVLDCFRFVFDILLWEREHFNEERKSECVTKRRERINQKYKPLEAATTHGWISNTLTSNVVYIVKRIWTSTSSKCQKG